LSSRLLPETKETRAVCETIAFFPSRPMAVTVKAVLADPEGTTSSWTGQTVLPAPLSGKVVEVVALGPVGPVTSTRTLSSPAGTGMSLHTATTILVLFWLWQAGARTTANESKGRAWRMAISPPGRSGLQPSTGRSNAQR
jgi:hypothetical protein